jgi:Uma2 family endonuclease
MDTVVTEAWTFERFLAWEDKQEGKHEFDGRNVIPMAGRTFAHQRIVINLCLTMMRLLGQRPLEVVQEMRLRTATSIRYPDVLICSAPVDQRTSTFNDAVALFEVLSADTAMTDRVKKLQEYAAVSSLLCYVLLEQTAPAATVFHRQTGGPWIASAHTDGDLPLPGLDLQVPLADLYRGLTFEEPARERPE